MSPCFPDTATTVALSHVARSNRARGARPPRGASRTRGRDDLAITYHLYQSRPSSTMSARAEPLSIESLLQKQREDKEAAAKVRLVLSK